MEIDRKGLFSYGSLLDAETLRRALNDQKRRIFTTNHPNELGPLLTSKPGRLVILRGVRLEQVCAFIISSEMIADHLGAWSESVNRHVRQVTGRTREPPAEPELYLMLRRERLRPRFIQGGVIFGLNETDFRRLDCFELAMENVGRTPFERRVYERIRATQLKVVGTLKPLPFNNVWFYAAAREMGKIHTVETRARVRELFFGAKKRRGGHQPKAACWPKRGLRPRHREKCQHKKKSER